jgi:hypothetical protein
MKRKMGFAGVTILLVSALFFCVFAQGQSALQNQPEKLQEEKQNTVRKTMLIDKQVITLLKAEIDGYGRVAHVQIPPASLNRLTTFPNARLRIETMDGSVQEIQLFTVKEVTIVQGGNIR